MPSGKWILLRKAVAELLEPRTFLSTYWYVSIDGSNQNPGTLAAPFRTIQAAANVAEPGDHVEIESGVYRETVIPSNAGTPTAPITYEAYDNEPVTISGADPVTGWMLYSGKIWRAPTYVDFGAGNNQYYVDGTAIVDARFPGTSSDPSHQTFFYASKAVKISTNNATIYNSNLNQPAGYWVGAVVHLAPGQAWIGEAGIITASSPGQITFTYDEEDQYSIASAGNAFYITDSFKALTSPGQFYRNAFDGYTYVWMPNGDSPNNHDVEVKWRQYAFDLSGKNDIAINDITFFACGLQTDAGSRDTVLNHVTASYISQFYVIDNGWFPAGSGIVLAGAYSIIENCNIGLSAGDGIYVSGFNCLVLNNIVHDADYSGCDCAGIRALSDYDTITDNTVYNTGRDAISFVGLNMTVTHNLTYDFGLQTTEAGGIYTHSENGQGSLIEYNQVHAAHSGGFGETGIYLDNSTNHITVFDNDAYDVDNAMRFNFTSEGNDVYNNNLIGTNYAIGSNLQGDWDGSSFTKNILVGIAQFGKGAVQKNNVTSQKAAGPGVGAGAFASGASGSIGAATGVPKASKMRHGPVLTADL